jgi:hypothetical protein
LLVDFGLYNPLDIHDAAPLLSFTNTFDKGILLKTVQTLKTKLDSIVDVNYICNLRATVENVSTSILLTSNFSEAAGRMSLENEITAYREFLEAQEITKNSILLIKPHPRDSKIKLLKLKSALSDLYSSIFVLDGILFYLPFEIFFMEVFLNPDSTKVSIPKIFTFSSACLSLEFLFNVQCNVGFGSNIVKKYFYKEHVSSRLNHEATLLSTIWEIRHLNA